MNFIKIIFSLFFLITAVNAEGEYMVKDPENTINGDAKGSVSLLNYDIMLMMRTAIEDTEKSSYVKSF